ncbi:MAG: MBL fold metallo-hydrolase [Deltaproteobacteria bacterium]|nr:MBL fold metallo-hydrolase [Deltaproteobacteria bacterium]MBW1930147.1 MBL fold metallo-hydrolase [Deltaproteobacteria bacterium]MBW2026600.1 MBL fold metallo-hydrolase [Deltaproteobacteria bacterium]MBW2126450.1 MBL fold metallo-hydrolase [Deltaproteobacteria bacterium]
MEETEEVRVIILGSGTGLPSSFRGSASIVFHYQGRWFLFDIGPGTLRQLTRIGIDHSRIEAIWVTHFHPDHTADLIHLIFATKHPKVLEHRKAFKLFGPRGVKQFVSDLQKAYGSYLALPKGVMHIEELHPSPQCATVWEELCFWVAPTQHTLESVAYRMETKAGTSIVYSGDSDFCQELISLSKGADLLILEASFPREEKVKGHLTPEEAGIIADQAKVKRLVLTHFYPECLKTNIGEACRKYFGGEITIASDFLTLVL